MPQRVHSMLAQLYKCPQLGVTSKQPGSRLQSFPRWAALLVMYPPLSAGPAPGAGKLTLSALRAGYRSGLFLAVGLIGWWQHGRSGTGASGVEHTVAPGDWCLPLTVSRNLRQTGPGKPGPALL